MAGLVQNVGKKLGSLVDAAMAGRLQCVARSDNRAVVVVGPSNISRCGKRCEPTAPLLEMLLAIPKGGPDDLFDRQPLELRDVEF